MTTRLMLSEEVVERTNRAITFTIADPEGAPLQPDTLKLTLYDAQSGELLGSRPAQQDVLNANGVDVTSGVVVWQPTPEDNAVVRTRPGRELHVALWEWTWDDSGTERFEKQEIAFYVVNLAYVPA